MKADKRELVIPSKARDPVFSRRRQEPRFLAVLGMTKNARRGPPPKNLGDAFSVPF